MNSKLKNIIDQIPNKEERLDIFGINDIQEKWKNKHKIFCKSKELPVESITGIRDTIYDLYGKATKMLVRLKKHYDKPKNIEGKNQRQVFNLFVAATFKKDVLEKIKDTFDVTFQNRLDNCENVKLTIDDISILCQITDYVMLWTCSFIDEDYFYGNNFLKLEAQEIELITMMISPIIVATFSSMILGEL